MKFLTVEFLFFLFFFSRKQKKKRKMGDQSGFPWAVKTGDIQSVRDGVETEGQDVNQVEPGLNKRTPLHWAADYGQLEVMQYLVDNGGTVDVPDNFGITPLLAAVYAVCFFLPLASSLCAFFYIFFEN
jgi:ankyrin repeat protein